MKKISLKSLNVKDVEQLSREQLKHVIGGWTGSGGSDDDGGSAARCFCGTIEVCHDDPGCNVGKVDGVLKYDCGNGDPKPCSDAEEETGS